MATFAPFQARPLDPAGRDEAVVLLQRSGVHGAYVANALAEDAGETVALWGSEGLLGLLWFGPRGNLVVVTMAALDPERVADAVHHSAWPFRIALGPANAIDALAGRLCGPPLVHRDQVYYGCEPAAARSDERAREVRPGARGDRERLMTATLELNRLDLNVDPRRVDRRWLKETVDGRIRDGSTRVLGPSGQFRSKLDLGSRGPAGLVLEGVYTFPESRGRGDASALVGAVAADAEAPIVCLHVAAANMPARRAYERAGMAPLGSCRLLLLG